MSEKSQLQEQVPENLLDERTVFTVQIVDSVSGQISDSVLTTDNPFSFNVSKFLPDATKFHIEDAIDLIDLIIQNAQRHEGIEESKRLQLHVEFTAGQIVDEKERIVYNVLKREPALMSRDGKSRPNRGWSHAYDFIPPGNPNNVVVVNSRPIDHQLQLSVWATTARACENRALWLERLMIGEAWRFRMKGAEVFHWEETRNHVMSEPGGQRLYGKNLLFKMRLREHFVISHPSIQTFEFTISN